MSYIDDIFHRMDLDKLSKRICTNLDYIHDEKRNYEQQLKEDCDVIFDILESLLPEGDVFEEVSSKLNLALAACETVYFEIGMKAGARLFSQLMFENEKGRVE